MASMAYSVVTAVEVMGLTVATESDIGPAVLLLSVDTLFS
jgi:hypothetical protein